MRIQAGSDAISKVAPNAVSTQNKILLFAPNVKKDSLSLTARARNVINMILSAFNAKDPPEGKMK